MFGSAITILAGAVLVWTMPAGAEKDGAQAVIGLLGMAFNAIAVGYFAVWAIRERKTITQMFRDLRNIGNA